MDRCLISLGANIGNPLETIRTAAELLRSRLAGTQSEYRLSRYFRTPPVGGPSGQPPFVNAVVAVHTELTAHEVWQAIREVESELGRQRDRRWEARRIDLDILLYGELRIWSPQLKIPHPRMCMRRFILVPALDVAPAWIDPVSGWSIAQLAAALQTGPGNLLLISDDKERHAAWLPEIAQQTRAEVIPLEANLTAPSARWLCLASMVEMRQLTETAGQLPLAKLVMFLTSPTGHSGPPAPASDWEVQHQRLAESLQLAPPQLSAIQPSAIQSNAKPPLQLPPTLSGPRYLLSGDDRSWAIHEIVSALEAMDCPVEPIAEALL